MRRFSMNKKHIEEATDYLKKQTTNKPTIGVILGSGLGDFVELSTDTVTIPYADIPHFPVSTVAGHHGELVFGTLNDKQIVAMRGRVHYYEGNEMHEVTFPVRVMRLLGVDSLVVTNAAGGINKSFTPGDFMLLTDHINQMGTNPLIGPNEAFFGERFTDLSEAYDSTYIQHAIECAEKLNISLKKGTYVANTGPTYETPAEVRMLRILGGDAVGMSTVPEVIVARHMSMRVLGISCISNMAAGMLDTPLSHEEVIETTGKARTDFLSLLKEILITLPEE